MNKNLALILTVVLAFCAGETTIETILDIINKSTIADISNAINDVDSNLDFLKLPSYRKMDPILHTMLNRLPEITEIRSDMRLVHGYVQRIDYLYDEFRSFSSNCSDWNPETLLEFSKTVTDHRSDGVAYTMKLISSIINPGTEVFSESLILRIIRKFKESELDACNEDRSPQQKIYDFYRTILITELRGLLLMSFAYMFRSSFKKTESNFTCPITCKNAFIGEQNYAFANFRMRIHNYTHVFREAMTSTSRALRSCDPLRNHIRGKTFHEFEKFMTSYIIPEEEINPNVGCTSSCDSVMPSLNHYYNASYGGEILSCMGRLSDCQSIGSVDICIRPRIKFEDAAPIRRYEWFKDTQGHKYGGSNEECTGELLHSRSRMQHLNYCDICVCTCTQDSYLFGVTRFVSLREVVSDIESNKVVTGVKFVSFKNVIQIQIQEGELARNGAIKRDSIRWKKPEKIRFSSYFSLLNKKPMFYGQNSLRNGSVMLMINEDVAAFDSQSHVMFLDELHVSKNHVMTGIKFDRIDEENLGGDYLFPIQLSIRATPFNYTTGKLANKDDSIWITPKDMRFILTAYQRERTEIKYGDDMKNPIERVSKTTPNFESNKFIRITKTGLRSDGGQTVIPLLDGLPVAANPAVPLSGVNLFHKSTEQYGGFLSFQIFTLDRNDDMFFVEIDGLK